ncbi:pseudouridine synthase [Shewanella sp. VB17]|uniref:pseudouridine synthase n=1 Tax=Shewanella sp. VB17 TaxID=2739432 RepID=UPI001563ABBC|nr:pseudouridine synthase [Shewanella sp. VB17]NRD73132.1 pseudouridine synthase [Shewanella sp. VB17]
MRLDKFLCKSTELTRSEATVVILAGEVLVNGEVVTSASSQIHENNHITLDGEKLTARASRYIMLHKPAGTLSSNVDGDHPSVFNFIPLDNTCELHIAGRLDADTTGLLLITDDGRWSFNVFNPKYRCEKVYRVYLRDPVEGEICGEIALEIQNKFEHGLKLQGEDTLTLPAKLEFVSAKEVLLTITEGRYHQVKRMFACIGNRVNRLHREQVGKIRLDVDVGQWRYLTVDEITSIPHH